MTAVSGSIPLLLPSPCVDRFGSLLFPFRGQHVGAASFTLCYGLLLCFPFSGSYNASTQSVTQQHRLPAIWLPDLYQNWTSTSDKTMIYQDAPTLCWAVFDGKTPLLLTCLLFFELFRLNQTKSFFCFFNTLTFNKVTYCGFA